MSYIYPSSLDSLALESYDQQPSQINEEAAAADLALWTNAKFTYDTTPGQGILDDKTTAPFDLDKVMYDQLVQYLDLGVNSAQQQPTPSTADRIGFDPTATTYNNKAIITPIKQQPALLPKPEITNNENFFLLSQQQQQSSSTDNTTNDNGKRPGSTIVLDDRASADVDKRKRNTAASARFRVKKKQKEQAMAQTVRDMTDKTEQLQSRVHELETEVKWLRALLLEKNSAK